MRNLLVIVLTFVPVIAHADRPRYSRVQKLDLHVPIAKRAMPVRAAVTPRGPSITGSDILAAEDRSQPIRREQEAVLEKLVADTPDDDPDKPDLMLRLAEHYARQHRFYRLKAIDIERSIAR
jgi:hypothetical protein